jgi:predicted metal-binding protein
MKEIVVAPPLLNRLVSVYGQMETEYDKVAIRLAFSCTGCPDNCCDSYFEHHTYIEWSYLWLGFSKLPAEKQKTILKRAKQYQEACTSAVASNQRPQVMCPLNENGLCILYPYRLLVCRTHGVPATMTRPDGRKIEFPGCFRCQELVKEKDLDEKTVARMERTPLLRQLALIENDLFAGKRHLYPKVKLTIAGMLLLGPPTVPTPHCER